MQGVFAISDIHGYCGALKEALDHVDLSGDNKLVLLGDYIDYGPQSGETLRYIHELQQRYCPEKVVALRGNHEEAFIEWFDTYSGPHAGWEYILFLNGLPGDEKRIHYEGEIQ